MASATDSAGKAAGKASGSWYGNFWSKPRALPPIFGCPEGRSSEALGTDKRIRDAGSIADLLSTVKERVASFDEGNLVIALCSGAKMVDDRSLGSMSSNSSWLLLQDRLREAIPRLEPRGLSMVAYALAKLAENKEGLLTELATASTKKATHFSATDVAKICWAFSKLDFIHEALGFWSAMADVVLRQVATARHVELSMIAWAFGTAQQGHDAMYAEIASCAMRMMQELTPQCLANIAVAFARQNRTDPELFGAISRRSRSLVRDFADFDVTNLCWASAKTRLVDRDLFHDLADHTVASRFVKRYSAEMAAQMCWAYAVAKVRHEPLFSELSDFIARHASVFEVQYVANCAWSYASLQVKDHGAWEALARECKGGRLWRHSEDQLSAVCWAFARIRWHHAELLQDMIQVASQRLAEFQSQSLINFFSALVVLSQEDWPCSVEDDHETEPHEDIKEILERVLNGVIEELQSRKLEAEEQSVVENLLEQRKSRPCGGIVRQTAKVAEKQSEAICSSDVEVVGPVADWRHMPFADWLVKIDPSGDVLCYLSSLEECYDTVAQVVQTYTLLDKASNRKTLDPLLFADLGISEVHRPLFVQWFVRFCGLEPSP